MTRYEEIAKLLESDHQYTREMGVLCGREEWLSTDPEQFKTGMIEGILNRIEHCNETIVQCQETIDTIEGQYENYMKESGQVGPIKDVK